MRYLLCALSFLLMAGCDNEFYAERVDIEISCETGGSELYLTRNYPKDVAERNKFFLEFTKKNRMNLCDLDSCIDSYSITFYDDCWCTRGYMERQDKLMGVESLYERCWNYSLGGFLYRRLNSNPSVWYLSYPKEFNDTIYCEQKNIR